MATNERELLAIVWALQNLRNYLYGVKKLNIFTDHQQLTGSMSDKNPNPRLKIGKGLLMNITHKCSASRGKKIT